MECDSLPPPSLAVSDAADVARTTAIANLEWAIDVRGHQVPTTWAAVGAYLADALPWTARHHDGPQFVDELTAALIHATRTIDRPVDRHYLGPCAGARVGADGLASVCGAALHGTDTGGVVCERCTTGWAVVDLVVHQLERIDDRELAAVDMTRVLAQVSINVPAGLIRLWKHRGPAPVPGRPRARPQRPVGRRWERAGMSCPTGKVRYRDRLGALFAFASAQHADGGQVAPSLSGAPTGAHGAPAGT